LLLFQVDVYSQEKDTLSASSIVETPISAVDSIAPIPKKAKSVIDSPIKYSARDSMPISMENGEQIIYLYGDASIEYGTIKLTAAYITVNFAQKEIFAKGIEDSLGVLIGKPHFAEGKEEFDCKTLRYNFVTRKGFTEDVVTEQQDGIVRGGKAKWVSNEEFCMVDGKYSTCDAEHPHFYLQMTKGKIIKDKAIITGRSYLVLEDFPLYFPFLPYGYIPTNKKSYTSGVLIPTYGEENNYGFYLKEGGFYWAASDYFDMKITGDLYSKGSWGVNFDTNYRKRYKYSGSIGFNIKHFVTGNKGIDQDVSKNFKVRWSHSQDSKANPSSSFSANVDFSTAGYNKTVEYDNLKTLNNSTSSGINFRKNFLNTPFSFNASARVAQNARDSTLALTLPTMTINMKSIEPFKSKKRVGAKRVWEDIKFSYTANIQNSIKMKESELFKTPLSAWQKSIDHSLPITLPSFKLLNYINLTPSVDYREKWFFKYIEKNWVDGYYVTDNETGLQKWVSGHTEEIEIDKFRRNYDFSGSISSSTTLYGLFQMKNQNGKIKAIRHKMDITAGFSYHPDFGDPRFKSRNKFYNWVQVDSLGNYQQYSVFSNGFSNNSESGSINFGVNNNIEMKLANDKDTTSTQKFKKIAIFDNIGMSGSYNLAADSMNLSIFSLNARTKIAGTSINISGSLDPYALDERGKRYNKFQWENATGLGKLGRLTNLSTGFSLGYGSDKKKKKDSGKDGVKSEAGDGKTLQEEGGKPQGSDTYAGFKMPWKINFNYSFNYNNMNNNPKIIQTVGFSGNLDFTEKWKSTFSSGFDIAAMKITHTLITITRDLHCWTMSFNFSPIGQSKFYSFTISANASMLKDLKLPPITDRNY